jgi:hypothetical protein
MCDPASPNPTKPMESSLLMTDLPRMTRIKRM